MPAWMEGSATFTTVMSRISMNCAAQSRPTTAQGSRVRRSTSSNTMFISRLPFATEHLVLDSTRAVATARHNRRRTSGTGRIRGTVRRGARMSGERMDRRVRRTREALRRALIEEILEKGYAQVTVQDIIDRADVGRSTFYAHFQDKDDLLFYGLEELRTAFDPARQDPGRSPTLAVFEHMHRSRQVWQAMAG